MFVIDPLFYDIANMEKEIFALRMVLWQKQLFGFAWWIHVGVLIFSWVIWAKNLDKNRLLEITWYGLLVSLITVAIDEIGSMLVLWQYPLKIVPLFPRLIVADYGVLPVSYMLIYQYFTSWKSYFLASVAMALVYSSIAEPLLVKMNFYVIFNWLHIYSFPAYIAMAVVCKWVINKVFDTQEKSWTARPEQ